MAKPTNKPEAATPRRNSSRASRAPNPNRKDKAQGKQPTTTTTTASSPPRSFNIEPNSLSASQKRQYFVFADGSDSLKEPHPPSYKFEDPSRRRSSLRSSLVNTAANTTEYEAPASEKQRKLKTNFGPRKSTTRKASLVAARSSEEVAVELPKQKAEDGDDELDDEDEDGTEVPVIIGGRNRSKDVKEKSRGGALKEKNKDKGVKGKNKEKAKGKNKEEAGGKKKEPNWFAVDTPELIDPQDANMVDIVDAPPTPSTQNFEVSGPAISSTIVTTTTITTTTRTTRRKPPTVPSTNNPTTTDRAANNKSASTKAATTKATTTKTKTTSTRATRGSKTQATPRKASSKAPAAKKRKTR